MADSTAERNDARLERPSDNEVAGRALLRRLRLGDRDALAELMREYWTPLVRYVTRLVGSADGAEDIVQDTFVAVWNQRATWDASGSIRALLYGIARRLVLKERRHQSVREKWADRIRRAIRPAPTPFDVAHHSELASALQAAIEALPSRRREAFVLCRYHGLTLREVAEIMQVSTQTVANQVSTAVSELRVSLEKFQR